MALGPFPCELIHDPQFEELVGHICHRPGMYVIPATFGAVCAFLDGFSVARSGGPLIGLKQWLVVRANSGNNVPWSGLAWQEVADGPRADAEPPDEERAIRALGRLLTEFFEYRRANGVTKVFHEYAKWLLRRSWYTGPLRRGSGQDTPGLVVDGGDPE